MRLVLARVRLLPALLTAIAVVLPLKLVSAWQGISVSLLAPVIGQASAREDAATAPKGAAANATEKTSGTDPGKPAPVPAAERGGPAVLLPGDKMPLTQTEIDLLQKLQERRDALDARERQLEAREGLVRAAEQSLDTKAKELAQLKASIEALAGKQAEAEEKKLQTLVAVYEKMKPKDAARILNDMEMDLLTAVVGGMKEAKIAPILAEMDASKARALTARLAERKTVPKLGS